MSQTATIYQFPTPHRPFDSESPQVSSVMGAPRSIAPLRLTKDYIPQFIAARIASGAAENTTKTYLRDLNEFADWVTSIDAPFSEIERWIDSLSERGYAASTIRLKHNIVSTFYGWLFKQRHISINPLKAERAMNLPKPAPKDMASAGFTAMEIAKMRQAVDEIERYGSKGRRSAILETRIVFMLAITTGMRLQEITNIRLSDFEVRDDVWWMNIPKAKWHAYGRYVRMERETVHVLLDYVEETSDERSRIFNTEDGVKDYLFVSASRPTARKRLCDRLGEVMDIAGTRVDGKGRQRQLFHAFRKTVISHAANQGASSGEIESAFGVGAATARSTYINPTLNQRHDHAMAAADELIALSKRAVESFESTTYTPFSERSTRKA